MPRHFIPGTGNKDEIDTAWDKGLGAAIVPIQAKAASQLAVWSATPYPLETYGDPAYYVRNISGKDPRDGTPKAWSPEQYLGIAACVKR
jgi:hypothetical protein